MLSCMRVRECACKLGTSTLYDIWLQFSAPLESPTSLPSSNAAYFLILLVPSNLGSYTTQL